MKTLRTNPGARRLMESLRGMGYDCSTAIADLVDNSVAAHSSEIHVDVLPAEEGRPAAIIIADNGIGMGREEMQEAMRFGSHQQYSSDDLGKYGLGLKTASLSQARLLTVMSKAKSKKGARARRYCMRWDINHVYKTNEWDLLVPDEDELQDWERAALNHGVAHINGTVVLWSELQESLPLLSSEVQMERALFLARLIRDISSHLSMVFHRFMQGSITGRRKLKIYVCGKQLEPWDPFCRSEDTEELDILSLDQELSDIDGSRIKEQVVVSPYILPRESEFSTPAAWKAASGPGNWNQQQGFYFYRNNRLLQAGGWSRLRAADEHTKLLRVAVDFPGTLDRAFEINVTKMRAKIPAELKDILSQHVSRWASAARTRYDGRSREGAGSTVTTDRPAQKSVTLGPATFSAGTPKTTGLKVESSRTGSLKFEIPADHDLAGILAAGKTDLKKLCLALLGLLEAAHDRKLPPEKLPVAQLRKLYKKL